MNDYASQFWVSNLDRRIMAITTFYGIPNARIVSQADTSRSASRLTMPHAEINKASTITTRDEGSLSATVTLDINEYELNSDLGLVEIPGTEQTAVFGKPILPTMVFEKVLPAGSTITNVDLLETKSKYVELPFQVSIGDFAFSEGGFTGVFTETGYYPAIPYQSYAVSTLGGEGVRVGLNIMAVQYNQDTETVRIWDRLVFEIEYSMETSVDTDADGLPDYWEQHYGLDTYNDSGDSGASADIDMDGLTNLDEYGYGTNPRLYDTDGDGVSDGLEITQGTDPNNYFSNLRFIYLPSVMR
jgi:hypothetical protein